MESSAETADHVSEGSAVFTNIGRHRKASAALAIDDHRRGHDGEWNSLMVLRTWLGGGCLIFFYFFSLPSAGNRGGGGESRIGGGAADTAAWRTAAPVGRGRGRSNQCFGGRRGPNNSVCACVSACACAYVCRRWWTLNAVPAAAAALFCPSPARADGQQATKKKQHRQPLCSSVILFLLTRATAPATVRSVDPHDDSKPTTTKKPRRPKRRENKFLLPIARRCQEPMEALSD